MAIFIEGITCQLCEKPLLANEERISFSPFVINELDPLWIFSDGVFHLDCVLTHQLGCRAMTIYEEHRGKTSLENRRCFASGKPITSADQYLGLGTLTSNRTDPLYQFNSAQFDRAALLEWSKRRTLIGLLREALSSGRMKGRGIEWLIEQLEKHNSF